MFHVRQAQHYCRNEFAVWDPKITTPPGLYLLSYAASPVAGCELVWLRALSLFCLTTLQAVLTRTYTLRRPNAQDGWTAQHNALNVTFLPPLFFFAALYYTDVPSTLSVALHYFLFVRFNDNRTSLWISTPVLTFAGVVSLFFRQTNIFWVAIFPAGITLVNQIDRGHQAVKTSMHRQCPGFGDAFLSIAKTSWKMEAVYNQPVRDAWIEGIINVSHEKCPCAHHSADFARTFLSITTCTLKSVTTPAHLIHLLASLAPFLTTLALFAAFILHNGTVVLGDKTNHVATLHLPQMLYIWPYFVVFSWPLVYPCLATFAFGILAKLPNIATLEGMLMFKRRSLTPRIWLIVLSTVSACVVVHFNTIVHPFTLADNRHYTFYVFRLLTRPWWIKYAVTPIYIVCGWASIQTLGARASGTTIVQEQDQGQGHNKRSLNIPDGHNGATTAFVLIWLITTALQLITAPLVEPRYLILPWIFWRIHVPLQQTSAPPPATRKVAKAVKNTDHRLFLETIWLLSINAVTGYMFLYRGFTWPQEPGKVQRFMW